MSQHQSDRDNRANRLFQEFLDANYTKTSRVFAVLMVAQWLFAILVAVLWSPYGWAGRTSAVHIHVWAAVFLGGAISSLPLVLTLLRPAALSTRIVVAVAQMLWSGLLIHLSGGRIETHFHVFVSLAFLAFYRDWRILVPATAVVTGDHLIRGIFWPESVYGLANPEWWRFLEHAFWVAFEDVVLVLACVRGVAETKSLAARHAEADALSESEQAKSVSLAEANAELVRSRDALKRLAEVGELAASVGHELRNPLAAVRNAHAYISKKALDPKSAATLTADPRIAQFLGVMDHELSSCSRIISDLLDFARDRPPEKRPCPLRPLVDDAVSVVPQQPHVTIKNEVPVDLPIPRLDRGQFRQILTNLIQNAVESIPTEGTGSVVVRAEERAGGALSITVTDDGIGIPSENAARIFQPLFTTKTKGTGLGLAIVLGIVERHGGTLTARPAHGKGTVFEIVLPEPRPRSEDQPSRGAGHHDVSGMA